MTYAFPADELRLYISQGLHKIDENVDEQIDNIRQKDGRQTVRMADVDLGANDMGNEN